jgi:hypothetical protein
VSEVPTIVRGDTQPGLGVTISDARETADFSTLTPADVRIKVEQGGEVIVDAVADTIVPAGDNKSAVVRRAWGPADTAEAGRCWVTVYVVPWDQTFPADGPMRIDITRAPGDV